MNQAVDTTSHQPTNSPISSPRTSEAAQPRGLPRSRSVSPTVVGSPSSGSVRSAAAESSNEPSGTASANSEQAGSFTLPFPRPPTRPRAGGQDRALTEDDFLLLWNLVGRTIYSLLRE